MINVLMISSRDFAGSGNRICESISKVGGNVKVRTLLQRPNVYNYPYDYCIDDIGTYYLQKLVNSADIIHFKGDELPSSKWNGLDIPNLPKIITVGGSGFRRGKSQGSVSLAWHDLELYKERTLFRSCITPDLNYKDFDGCWTPHCIDMSTDMVCYNFDDIIIQHSPSHREKKGTDKYIIPAINRLQSDGFNFQFELLEKMSNQDVIYAKKRGSLFIDQVCDTGWYGMSSVESMQYGIPILCHISEESKEQMGKDINLPILGVDLSVDSVYETIKGFLLMSKVEKRKLVKKTIDYCYKIHSYDVNGRYWVDLYNKIYEENKELIYSVKQDLNKSKELYTGQVLCKILSKKVGKIGNSVLVNSRHVDRWSKLGFIEILK